MNRKQYQSRFVLTLSCLPLNDIIWSLFPISKICQTSETHITLKQDSSQDQIIRPSKQNKSLWWKILTWTRQKHSLNLPQREGATGQAAWLYQSLLGQIPSSILFNLLKKGPVCSVRSIQRSRVVDESTRRSSLPAHDLQAHSQGASSVPPRYALCREHIQIPFVLGCVSNERWSMSIDPT